MNSWLRLWHDMPTDPKFRVIAKRSGRPLCEVLSVYVLMLTNASANATERGRTQNWSDEDAAAALDLEPEHVAAIREAMEGKLLDGDLLTGWEKRQPMREDGSAERARAWRERNRTHENAAERPDTDTEEDTDKKREEGKTRVGARSPGLKAVRPTKYEIHRAEAIRLLEAEKAAKAANGHGRVQA